MKILRELLSELWRILSFIFNDLKEDIKWAGIIIGRFIEGKPIIDPEKKNVLMTELKNVTPSYYFKTYWHWLVVILFAVVCGWVMASKYYEIQCNNLIIDTYIKPQLEKTAMNITNTFNFSMLK